MRRKLVENFKRVEDRIEAACARVGRRREDVTLVVVTKSVSLDVIHTLIDMGVADLGESRVQALTQRAAMVAEWRGRRAAESAGGTMPQPRWHMIGHLQRNKVKAVLPWIEMIHSVDTLRLAEEINNCSAKLDRITPIMVEVNASEEKAKYGVPVAATTHLCEQIATLPHVQVTGLMAMAPFVRDEAVILQCFGRVRELFDEIVGERLCGPEFGLLSLGMSNDFEYGIEAGATHVRIGTALFEGIEPDSQLVEPD